MRTSTHCHTLQCTANHCNTLQHTTTHCQTLQHTSTHNTLPNTATHFNTLQHTGTHCNTLQHTATHCNTLQHTNIEFVDIAVICALCLHWNQTSCPRAPPHLCCSVLPCVAVCCSELQVAFRDQASSSRPPPHLHKRWLIHMSHEYDITYLYELRTRHCSFIRVMHVCKSSMYVIYV